MKRKAVTILEILISIVILAIGVGGLAGIFVTSKSYIEHSKSRIVGGELGKLFLNPLQMAVREDTWGATGNALNIGTTYCDGDAGHAAQQNSACPPANARRLNNIPYTAQYDISEIQLDPTGHPNSKLRKVVATIGWTELRP